VYLKVQSNLLGSSNDRGVYLKCTRRLGTQKYLRKSCCHCIECSAVNFLAAFMWRRPLNSTALAFPIHRGPERVFNGTSTQVVV